MSLIRHGLLIPHVCKMFEDLQVAGALYFLEKRERSLAAKVWRGGAWIDIHALPNLLDFEVEHGLISKRHVYNGRCIRQVLRTKKTVLGEHAGFADLFVPIGTDQRVQAVLVTGPFATQWPTSTDILERWRRVAGRQGHPADPEFAHYVAVTLSTLVLEGKRVDAFRRLLERLADLMVARDSAETIASDLAALRSELLQARFPELVWEAARQMVDERTSRIWSDPVRGAERLSLGLTGAPEHVAVGLFTSRIDDEDNVADLVRRYAFQRACVELARSRSTAVSGRIGENGVTFLAVGQGSSQRSRRMLIELVEQASSLARKRFGLALHCGVSVLSLSLPGQYQAALAAAESALSRGLPLVNAESPAAATGSLGKLRQELAELIEKDPRALPAHLDRFLEAVAVRSAYRAEPARAHIEAAFERLTEVLLRSGALEPRSAIALQASMEKELVDAGTISDIFRVYRRAASDMVAALEHPVAAHRERSLRRGEEYLRQHYAEPITLEQVAKVSGFAPTYFSRLFHEKQRMTFASYLRRLRIERAQELLIRTPLSLRRVAQLCGFSSADYLGRVFQRTTSETPIHYRWRARHEKRAARRRKKSA
jgi:AraC-like DNA-binding protein